MTRKGRLFIFEGPDGVGKSTLAKMLQTHLQADGEPCECLAFPGKEDGTLGHHIYRLHHEQANFGVASIHPASLQILHVAAHIDSIERRIRPALDNGISIVLDRYWWSTAVYGKVAGVNDHALRAMLDAELIYWSNIVPAAGFLVRRVNSLHATESTQNWAMLSAAYYELACERRKYHPVHFIMNDGGIDDTFQSLVTLVDETELSQQKALANQKADLETFQLPLTFDTAEKEIWRYPTTIVRRLSPAKPTIVFDTYWRFASERQNIFFARFDGKAAPWTNDPILQRFKFTNAYRASDRVSQYLIRQVIYEGSQDPNELFFRIMIFKFFNKIGTWEMLKNHNGEMTYADYSFERFDEVLSDALEKGTSIFSAAYIMPSGNKAFGFSRKHRNYLRLLEKMIQDSVPLRLRDMRSMREAFELLCSYPMIGDFLAYQFVTDFNYSSLTNFTEKEFVIPGPGARDGIHKCFESLGGLNETDIIRLMADRQQDEFDRLGIEFQSLWGRPLQLIDCQNLFCEVDKYARLAHPTVKGISNRKRIKQTYQGKNESINYWYPPDWGINDLIQLRKRSDDTYL